MSLEPTPDSPQDQRAGASANRIDLNPVGKHPQGADDDGRNCATATTTPASTAPSNAPAMSSERLGRRRRVLRAWMVGVRREIARHAPTTSLQRLTRWLRSTPTSQPQRPREGRSVDAPAPRAATMTAGASHVAQPGRAWQCVTTVAPEASDGAHTTTCCSSTTRPAAAIPTTTSVTASQPLISASSFTQDTGAIGGARSGDIPEHWAFGANPRTSPAPPVGRAVSNSEA